jgi:DNA-directed RNA polymerase subunit M
MFCPKCKSILLPKKKGTKVQLVCSGCGYTSGEGKAVISEKVHHDHKEMEIIRSDTEVLPTTDVICPKCGNKKAYYWFLQTRASDEPETQFLKCTECKHQWRVYD